MALVTTSGVIKPARKKLIDEYDSTTTYVGEGPIGGDTSQAIWRIKKIIVNGTVTTILYADGDDRYNNIWANRTALTYL